MKIEPMKNHIDRTSENLAEMRALLRRYRKGRTTDPQLKELLETVLDALEDVGALLRRYRKGRLDQLELEPENYC